MSVMQVIYHDGIKRPFSVGLSENCFQLGSQKIVFSQLVRKPLLVSLSENPFQSTGQETSFSLLAGNTF